MDGEDVVKDGATAGKPEECPCGKSGCCGVMFGLCLMVFVAIVLGCGLEDFSQRFWDVPSLAIIGGIVIGGWLTAHGWCGCWRAVKVLVINRAANPAEARLAKDFCANGIWLALLSGALGTIIGAINILAGGYDWNMPKPVLMSVITSSMALCILTFFWSWVFALPLVALYYRAKGLVRTADEKA